MSDRALTTRATTTTRTITPVAVTGDDLATGHLLDQLDPAQFTDHTRTDRPDPTPPDRSRS